MNNIRLKANEVKSVKEFSINVIDLQKSKPEINVDMGNFDNTFYTLALLVKEYNDKTSYDFASNEAKLDFSSKHYAYKQNYADLYKGDKRDLTWGANFCRIVLSKLRGNPEHYKKIKFDEKFDYIPLDYSGEIFSDETMNKVYALCIKYNIPIFNNIDYKLAVENLRRVNYNRYEGLRQIVFEDKYTYYSEDDVVKFNFAYSDIDFNSIDRYVYDLQLQKEHSELAKENNELKIMYDDLSKQINKLDDLELKNEQLNRQMRALQDFLDDANEKIDNIKEDRDYFKNLYYEVLKFNKTLTKENADLKSENDKVKQAFEIFKNMMS